MVSIAGEITSAEAWRRLERDPEAVLVDVRTQAEWTYVGVPDLSALGRQVVLVQWQAFPGMQVNPAFAEQLASLGVRPDQTVLFLCRSGARSRSAAELMALHGYGACYNVSDGFEGGLDGARHRGGIGGWKWAGLPWLQG